MGARMAGKPCGRPQKRRRHGPAAVRCSTYAQVPAAPGAQSRRRHRLPSIQAIVLLPPFPAPPRNHEVVKRSSGNVELVAVARRSVPPEWSRANNARAIPSARRLPPPPSTGPAEGRTSESAAGRDSLHHRQADAVEPPSDRRGGVMRARRQSGGRAARQRSRLPSTRSSEKGAFRADTNEA